MALNSSSVADAQDVMSRVFTLARDGRLDPEIHATVLRRIRESGNEALLQAFVRAGAVPDPSRTGDESNGNVLRMRERFSAIYDRNEWLFGSGVGSLPENNLEYAKFLQEFMVRNKVRSVLDFGCGDWQFSRFIDWSRVDYMGVDVVPMLIEKNRRQFGQENVKFELFRSLEALPKTELLVCKDVLQHLPNAVVRQYLDAFRMKSKFILITNDDGYPTLVNADIEVGGWRTLQFDRPPFSERAAVLLRWLVEESKGWSGKATYLFYGNVQDAGAGSEP